MHGPNAVLPSTQLKQLKQLKQNYKKTQLRELEYVKIANHLRAVYVPNVRISSYHMRVYLGSLYG